MDGMTMKMSVLFWFVIWIRGCCFIMWDNTNALVVDAFVMTQNVQRIRNGFHSRRQQRRHCVNHYRHRRRSSMTMLRNVDLPECVVFYGVDTVLEPSWSSSSSGDTQFRPGVIRLCEECVDVDTGIIWLSEQESSQILEQLWDMAMANHNNNNNKKKQKVSKDKILFQCSKEVLTLKVPLELQEDTSDEESSYGKGFGYAPSPAALVDAISSVAINPRGFGGSSGFSSSQHMDPQRNPLPPHTVVFVSSLSNNFADRCLASWYAGMRVLLIAEQDFQDDANLPADAIIDLSLGTEQDWSMTTLDDISTPGSFWLNMAQPRGLNGDRIDTFKIIQQYADERSSHQHTNTSTTNDDDDEITNQDEMDEDEMAKILADLDSL